MKEVGGFIIFTIIVCLIFNTCTSKKVDKAYAEGKQSGYKVGYAEIEVEYKKKIEEQTSIYERKIKDQEKVYEKKMTVALQEGFNKGKKDRQQEVEDNLQRTTAEKESKGKWNDVLFDVKN